MQPSCGSINSSRAVLRTVVALTCSAWFFLSTRSLFSGGSNGPLKLSLVQPFWDVGVAVRLSAR
eukprot:3179926-Amphidinium_carterae.1